MASITTRETGTTGTGGVTRKDLPLTNAEIDTNFINRPTYNIHQIRNRTIHKGNQYLKYGPNKCQYMDNRK